MANLTEFEKIFNMKIASSDLAGDPAHDLLHVKRVVETAKVLSEEEGAKLEVVIPAAWLHDFVVIPKNDPRRKEASRISAEAAIEFLKEIKYPEKHLTEIAHAISAHSFSANIEPQTVEAKVVQDSDRLDGLGAIGIARCFATAGLLRRTFYSELDPFCELRAADDGRFTLDHFYAKLFITAETLKTKAGRDEGQKRVKSMRRFLDDLRVEIQG